MTETPQELPARCPHCNRPVRVVWSAGDDPRPAQLRCPSGGDWQMPIPASAVTKEGTVLTDALVQELADEAQAGYDPARLRPRRSAG